MCFTPILKSKVSSGVDYWCVPVYFSVEEITKASDVSQ